MGTVMAGSGSCSSYGSGNYDGCDSSFVYCLSTLDGSGCPGGGLRSHVNYDDTTIDFSQNTVLGLNNPLIFQGLTDTWKGVQLYVRIWDIDEGNSLELIDEVKWNITHNLGVPSGVVNLTGMYEIVTMKVNITVLCVPVPGFTGMMCDENIDDCVGVLCGENGHCVDGVNSFTCNCTAGFTGVLCNETEECVNVNCSERGQCVAGVASYMCDCDAGYSGENCEVNVNDCLLNPCGEAGQCMDEVNSFICVCHPGFTGELCQINIDDCAGVSCSGNGQCVDGVDTFMCVCHPGFTGELCQINIDDCTGVSCGGNGQCVNGVDTFMCVCHPGFTGELSQINIIDDCVGVNCSGNGECVDEGNTFICECSPGYKGLLCDKVSDRRQSFPVIPIVSGAVGALLLILILVSLLVIITLTCASKCCSKLVSKSDDVAISKTIEMKENEVYGVSIMALEPERPPQESVLMNRNICYATIQDFKS